MKLADLFTPKNEDGSLDQRYKSLSNQICDLAGEKCRDVLYEFYDKTNKLESKAAGAALHFVKKSFEVKMDECQRKPINKSFQLHSRNLDLNLLKSQGLSILGDSYLHTIGLQRYGAISAVTPS